MTVLLDVEGDAVAHEAHADQADAPRVSFLLCLHPCLLFVGWLRSDRIVNSKPPVAPAFPSSPPGALASRTPTGVPQ
jgi:hypothetical protein